MPPQIHQRPVWTAERDNSLALLWEVGTAGDAIATTLGVSLGAVRKRAVILGLHRPRRWNGKRQARAKDKQR